MKFTNRRETLSGVDGDVMLIGCKSTFRQVKTRLVALPEWNHDNIESAIRGLAEDENEKPAAIIHPARYAVSGRTMGPSLFELLEALGRVRVLRRL
jgi:glutamyl-tRNA synthetase